MTERGKRALRRSRDELSIGRSALRWSGDGLTISLDEICAPWPRRIRGEVRLAPSFVNPKGFSLEAQGGHAWRPIAPRARVDVELEHPHLRWRGEGYFDANSGSEPLQRGFRRWTWSRARTHEGAAILYDAERRREGPLGLALRFTDSGALDSFEAPAPRPLPRTFWRLEREMRSDDSAPAVDRDFEDTPFYSRSLVSARWLGESVGAMSETLSLDRFANPLVRAMLPFRMPRV